MDLYVLDTDILSLYQRGHVTVCDRVERHELGTLAVTIITVEEQLSGWYTVRRRRKGRKELAHIYDQFTESVRLLARMQILSFTERAIDQYERLRQLKLRVRTNDLRIAAIALENSAIVVTRNRVDFEQIPGLQIEDWSA
jgi:tRNA(fMet)-specific endonuclease VapC